MDWLNFGDRWGTLPAAHEFCRQVRLWGLDLPCLQSVDNTLNIKIVSTDGSEVFFKIKKTTKLNKLKVSFSL